MKGKTVARCGLLTALAMVLSYVETLVPLSLAVPGVKLGLANLAVIFALYRIGPGTAALLSLLRVVLVSFTFGNAYSFWYSLAGAALSFAVMWVLRRRNRLGELGVSVAGGVCHNIAQIAVAAAVLRSAAAVYYLPVLLVSGVLAGLAVGTAAAVLIRRIPDFAA